MASSAIKGHATRGKEIIEILEMLGGKNKYLHFGESESYVFYITNGIIDCDEVKYADDYIIYTLEEFLEKFPYKVGDKAFAFGNKCTIIDAVWDEGINEVVYTIKLDTSKYTTTKLSNQLQPYKEETMDKVNKAVFDANAQCCDIMNRLIKEETMEGTIKMNPLEMSGARCIIPILKGYEFAGVDDDKQQVVFEKIGYQYPKTYVECCEVFEDNFLNVICLSDDEKDLFYNIIKMKRCRDAYWRLYGEHMGLGKPWKPDWGNEYEHKYVICRLYTDIVKETTDVWPRILAFPTKEMRDAFYENFKDLIEECKELL